MAAPQTSFYEEHLLCSGRNMQGSRNCIHISVSSSSIVFLLTTVTKSTPWLTFCYTPVACLTIFNFFKKVAIFHPSLTLHSLFSFVSSSFFLSHRARCLACAVIAISKNLEFRVSKLCTLSLGTIMHSGVSCKEKNRRWTEDAGNKRRRQGEKNIHMSCGQIQQVRLSNLPN